MTNSKLKMIAIVSMLIDHTGAVLLPQFFFLRMIGRLAFPIFAFLLVEGLSHTSNKMKYLIRLGVFALISEIPYDLAFYHETLDFNHQNIFWTLFLGLCLMMIIEKVRSGSMDQLVQVIISVLAFIGISYISEVLHTDYGVLGIMTIGFFYIYRDRKALALSNVALLHIVYGLLGAGFPTITNAANAVQALAALSMLLIVFYNGEKGRSLKYFFYVFYPAHLLILAGIDQLILANI